MASETSEVDARNSDVAAGGIEGLPKDEYQCANHVSFESARTVHCCFEWEASRTPSPSPMIPAMPPNGRSQLVPPWCRPRSCMTLSAPSLAVPGAATQDVGGTLRKRVPKARPDGAASQPPKSGYPSRYRVAYLRQSCHRHPQNRCLRTTVLWHS